MKNNLLKRITNRGVEPGMNVSDEKIVVITNYILLLASMVAFLRIFMFYLSGDFIYSLVSITSSMLFLFAYYLNTKGYFDLAKYFLIIVGNSAVLWKELTSGGQGHQLFLIIASFSTVFLLFNIRNRMKLLIALAIPATSFVFSVFFPNLLPVLHIPNDGQTMLLEKFFGALSAVIIVVFVTWYFVKKSLDAETKLINTNRQLQHFNREINTQKDKIEELLTQSDKLLLNILPEKIADRLKTGETLIADYFDEASIIFIDIVSFTNLTKISKPQTIVSELNKIFTMFDKLSEKYGIEKIKTLGDCYMAVAGIPEPRKDHAHAISRMAVESMKIMKGYKTEDGHEVKFRIGIDCGPVVAGVIGEQKFIYDLWGESVNTASRMKDFGVVDKIQCTEKFVKKLSDPLLPDYSGAEFNFVEREEIEIKGMGKMRPYFLSINE